MGKWVHRLSEIDPEAKRAVCANCGPVQLTWKGGRWRCKAGRDAQRGSQGAHEAIRAAKDAPCMDCGGYWPDHPEVMDLDHRPGEGKTDSLSRLLRAGADVADILAEIAKCDLVCSNCHRIRTSSRTK